MWDEQWPKPTAKSYYWFYGQARLIGLGPSLHMIEITPHWDSWDYWYHNTPINSKVWEGVWQPMTMPELPATFTPKAHS